MSGIFLVVYYNFRVYLPKLKFYWNDSEICITRKYPLRGYFLGALTHTTAWDRLLVGEVFLILYIHSSASPHVAAVL